MKHRADQVQPGDEVLVWGELRRVRRVVPWSSEATGPGASLHFTDGEILPFHPQDLLELPTMTTKTPRKKPVTWFAVTDAGRWVHLDWLEPWSGNPRFHSEIGTSALADLILSNGFASPMEVHAGDAWPARIVGGHGRRLAMKKILAADPDFVVPGAPGPGFVPAKPHVVGDEEVGPRFATWTESEDQAVASNRAQEFSSWDSDALAKLVKARVDLESADARNMIDRVRQRMALQAKETRALLRRARAPKPAGQVRDRGPRARPENPDSKLGQVYELGPHRLICGDSRDPKVVEALLEGDLEPPAAVNADAPYGQGKASAGVLNDRDRGDKLQALLRQTWETWRPRIAPAASVVLWGRYLPLWELWLLTQIEDETGKVVQGLRETDVTLRNAVVWDKGKAVGMNSPDVRKFPEGTERALFFVRGEPLEVDEATAGFWEGYEELRAYQADQFARMGWESSETQELTGVGMFGHWTTRSQWRLVPEVHWNVLAAAAEGKAFQRPHRELREAFERLRELPDHPSKRPRAFFDNTVENMTDVWAFPGVTGADRLGHPTPKPVELVERRIVLPMTEPGQVLAIPFGGTAPGLIAAARTGRLARVVELDPGWCDVIRDRWTRWALEAGRDPGPGALSLGGS